jgi:hypothetical protein
MSAIHRRWHFSSTTHTNWAGHQGRIGGSFYPLQKNMKLIREECRVARKLFSFLYMLSFISALWWNPPAWSVLIHCQNRLFLYPKYNFVSTLPRLLDTSGIGTALRKLICSLSPLRSQLFMYLHVHQLYSWWAYSFILRLPPSLLPLLSSCVVILGGLASNIISRIRSNSLSNLLYASVCWGYRVIYLLFLFSLLFFLGRSLLTFCFLVGPRQTEGGSSQKKRKNENARGGLHAGIE